MRIKHMVTRPLHAGRDLAAKKIIRQFAHKYGLVYLGNIDRRSDDHELIRGVTASSGHQDAYFCVGEYKGYDISLVERRNDLALPGGLAEPYHWLIMQVDTKRSHQAHIYLDAHKHDHQYYQTLFASYSNMVDANSFFSQEYPLFARTFLVITQADRLGQAAQLLGGQVPAMLAHHFKQFDYEIDREHVLVYAPGPIVSPHLLQEMLRVGYWLATQLDNTPES